MDKRLLKFRRLITVENTISIKLKPTTIGPEVSLIYAINNVFPNARLLILNSMC